MDTPLFSAAIVMRPATATAAPSLLTSFSFSFALAAAIYAGTIAPENDKK
jgi:hypothetical protein